MGSAPTSKTWLITGASQGLGLAMTLGALNAGHKVIAGARNPDKAAQEHPEVEAAGGKWLALDVDAPETKDIVKKNSDEVGGFDVVVNNAGYFLSGTIEELEEDEMDKAFQTNFWGPIRVLKGALPAMKARKSGTIVYISSIFGFTACPNGAMYNCPKAAVDMLQSTMGIELATYNIRPVTITAGLYKTKVLENSKQPTNGFSEADMTPIKVELLGTMGQMIADPDSMMPGDPAKFAQRIVEIVDSRGMGKGLEKCTRFLFGKDAVQMSSEKMDELSRDFATSRDIACSTDFEGTTAKGVAVVTEMVKSH